ncbi:hypothetical protein P154DRAFT_426597 [Amniculicola lignicola CBS 123094]|uniref:THO complex subunit 2 n=1 Tax=Amniculicola lignicola CBS 123094 TaxID=1392246 RepID=A0A6A5WTY4_9PLEO|nr:hypothetical protein P154DRAFT_426597 [Amniculicola lignicola CBS 123094]
MAPASKRKRGDRTNSQDDEGSGRPSPHRPQNLTMANSRGGGRRGGRQGPRAPTTPHDANASQQSPNAMAAPATTPASKPQTTPTTPAPVKPQVASKPADAPEPMAVDEPKARPLPEINEYLTAERLESWRQGGRAAIVEAAMQAQAEGDALTLSMVYEELFDACLERQVDAEEIGAVVGEIIAGPSALEHVDAIDQFLEFVSSATLAMETAPPSLRPMLEATGIDPQKMREVLEDKILMSLHLVRPSFAKVAIRKATLALYRQSNYNLLREESEGYAKLATEYFTTVGNSPPSLQVVTASFEKVKALIGSFDLDVGRSLDVTLDVFANLLVKHNQFFVKLLRMSSWWPEQSVPRGVKFEEPLVSTLPGWAQPDALLWYYNEEEKAQQMALRERRDEDFWKSLDEIGVKAYFLLGGRRITHGVASTNTNDQVKASEDPNSMASDLKKMFEWGQDWMTQTGTLPPSGNRVAAQVLGFKLRFYASDRRSAHDQLPDNLIYLAALLIKIGFISIEDLYPHLYPLDEDMNDHKEKLRRANQANEESRHGVPTNALAMAGALPDDTRPAPSSVARLRESESKLSSKSTSEQGTPAEAEEAAQEKLPEPTDQKTALLRSLLTIGAIPEALYILGRWPWLLEVDPDLNTYIFRIAHHSLSKVYEQTKDGSRIDLAPGHKQAPTGGYAPRKVLRWAKPDQKDAGDGIDYTFYWGDWTDNVPICQTVDDIFKFCDTLLGLSGIRCGKDATLLAKLTRIGKWSLTQDSSEFNTRRWIKLTTVFLAPALTYSDKNTGVADEVWELMKRFDTPTRYGIYSVWVHKVPNKPENRATFTALSKEVHRIMNRVAKENVKTMGRQVARLSYGSPGVVLKHALKSGETYPNMIDALVECSRYLTYLAYDCLSWVFISSFNENRSTVKDDGMLATAWLRNTALFVGKAYKRYGNMMDPTPMVQCIAMKLTQGDLFMLEVLEQLIKEMSGIKPLGSLSESQVVGISLGPQLRSFTLHHYLGDERNHVQYKKSVERLLRCLMITGQAPVILITLALELHRYICRPELADVPLKVLSTNLDNLHGNFAQYLDFLKSNLSAKAFNNAIPGLVELISDYDVNPALAFIISREGLMERINAARTATTANGDFTMGNTENVTTANGTVAEGSKLQPATSQDVEMKESPAEGKLIPPVASGHVNPEIEVLAVQLREQLPEVYGNHICLTFLITFWQLSLPDLFDISMLSEYDTASKHFNKESARSKKPDSSGQGLRQEAKVLGETAIATRKCLQDEMRQWFAGVPMIGPKTQELHAVILLDCFLPRIRYSLQDSHFAFALLKFMHSAGVPGFRTMMLLDQLFKKELLMDVVCLCSDREATNLGRFLNEVLRELHVWHTKETDYTKFAHGDKKRLPGFGRTFNPDRTPATMLPFEDYRRVLFKWHSSLTQVIVDCLKSDNYLQIRNAIVILKAVSSAFPAADSLGRTLKDQVVHLSETEERQDLKLAATSLLGDFKKGMKRWISDDVFKLGRVAANELKAANARSQPASKRTQSPQPDERPTKKPAFNATALEFAPKSSSNGVATPVDATSSRKTERNGKGDSNRTVTPATAASTNKYQESNKPFQSSLQTRTGGSSAPKPVDMDKRGFQQEVKPAMRPSNHASQPPLSAARPDSRGGPVDNRVVHALPTRPDAQPPRIRPVDRPVDRPDDRPSDYSPVSRNPPRNLSNADYPRPERSGEALREPFPERREASPRRNRGRTPERREPTWPAVREPPRDYYEERNMRPLPHVRGPPPSRGAWEEHRDYKDSRDPRERPDLRAPLPAMQQDTRGRMQPRPEGIASYRREPSPKVPQPRDNGALPPRPIADTPNRSGDSVERTSINPERAALINNPRDDYRSNRDARPQRPLSPRRMDDRPPTTYQNRPEPGRTYRDDRNEDRHTREKPLVQAMPAPRDRRDEPTGNAPTGPRSGRYDAPPPSRNVREMFQAPQSRSAPYMAQDPNHGRLSPPTDNIASARQNQELQQGRAHTPLTAAPTGPAIPTGPAGVHPSRLTNFQGPPALQTDMQGIPSGPRNIARTPQGSGPLPSPRGAPTGPGGNFGKPTNRGVSHTTINTHVQDVPVGQANNSPNVPTVRGRGSIRASGNLEPPSSSNQAPTPSHPDTVNTPRAENTPSRVEQPSQEEGKYDSRGHRDSRRSERSGRRRSRSPERSDRRPDDRSTRGYDRNDEKERAPDRERGSDKDRRSSDRDAGRRERRGEWNGESRGRGGGGGGGGAGERRDDRHNEHRRRDDGRGRDDRKRTRTNEEPPQGDSKRPRRSN